MYNMLKNHMTASLEIKVLKFEALESNPIMQRDLS